MKGGQLLADGHTAKALTGEVEDQEKRLFTIAVDSKDEAKTMVDVPKALRRLREFTSVNYVASDDHLGQMVRRLLEYKAQRTNMKVRLTLEKVAKETRGRGITRVANNNSGS